MQLIYDKHNEKSDELFDDAENHLKEEPEDWGHYLGLQYHEGYYYTRYKIRYHCPGFIKGTYRGMNKVVAGAAYYPDTGWGWFIGIYSGTTGYFDMDIDYINFLDLRPFRISLPVKVFADTHERLGIRLIPSFYYINQRLGKGLNTFLPPWVNYSVDFSVGFHLNHHLLLFAGYKGFYYNKSNPYRFTGTFRERQVWNDNNYYAGTTVYLYKDTGITLEYSYKKIMTYLDIMFFRFGYDITGNKWTLSIFGYGLEHDSYSTRSWQEKNE